MKKIIPSMIAALLIGVLLLPGKSAFAVDKINVTLPSKSFQFIIFPLAKERGYMTLAGDLDEALNELKKERAQSLERLIAGLK